MKDGWLLVSLLLVSVTANAKERPVPLSPSVAAQLNGKSVVVTRHEKPGLYALTPGKAAFGLIGVRLRARRAFDRMELRVPRHAAAHPERLAEQDTKESESSAHR